MPVVTHTGDVALARAEYDRCSGANLRYALRKRFSWMQREAAGVLRQEGYLLVGNLGKTTEWALRLIGHEGYDWSADPVDASRPCNDLKDP